MNIDIRTRFLLGPVHYKMPIERHHDHKLYVPYDELPVAEFYPDYISGSLRITNPGTARLIAEAAQEVQFFRMEDVWVSGYIAQYLDIELQVSKH